MSTSFEDKSTLEEIRKRFDSDVECFSNLETGQAATIDAPLGKKKLICQLKYSSSPSPAYPSLPNSHE